MHISSKYAKIFGETNFQPREFSQSGKKWKMTKMKMTIMEDDQNGRQPKWKRTKMEDDQN